MLNFTLKVDQKTKEVTIQVSNFIEEPEEVVYYEESFPGEFDDAVVVDYEETSFDEQVRNSLFVISLFVFTKFRVSSRHLRSQISTRRSRSSPRKSFTKVTDGQSGRLTKNAPQMRPQRKEVLVKATTTMVATPCPTIAARTPKPISTVTMPKTPPCSPSTTRSTMTIQRTSPSSPFLTTRSMVRMTSFWAPVLQLIYQV